MTIFAASGNSRTFDYQAGDIAYISPSVGHFIESTGNTTLKFLEIFKSPVYEDVSLSQWLALTPKQIVQVSPISFIHVTATPSFYAFTLVRATS